MTVRDRYDQGREKQLEAEKRAGWIRNQVQRECERHTIGSASDAVRAGTAGPFAVAVVAAWHAQRAEEGW